MIRSEQAAGARFFLVTNDTALGLNWLRVGKLPCDEEISLRVKIIIVYVTWTIKNYFIVYR